MAQLFRQGKRRLMKTFRIDELAAVDVPAQGGATALLLKRADAPAPKDGEPSDTELAEIEKHSDSTVVLLTSEQDGHAHNIWVSTERNGGETSWSKSEDEEGSGHSHPWVVDANGNVTVGASDGHTHTVDSSMLVQAIMARAYYGKAGMAGGMASRSMTASQARDAKRTIERRTRARDRRKLSADTSYDKAAMADGSFPIVTVADLRSAMEKFDGSAAVAKHIRSRAEALDASDLLPTVGELAKALSNQENTMTDAEKAALDAAVAKAARAEAIVALPTDQRTYFDKLDAAGQSAFLAKSAADRASELAAAVTKAADADPIVYTALDGSTFRKSDDSRLIAAVKRADDNEKRAIAERAVSENARLEKRAGEEIGNLKGDTAVKVALLKAIESISDETLRKGALEAVVSGDKAMKAAFDTVGHEGRTTPVGDADAELTRLAKAHQTKVAAEGQSIDFVTAYDVVSQANPALAKRAIEGK